MTGPGYPILHPPVPEDTSPTIYGAYLRRPALRIRPAGRAMVLLAAVLGGPAAWMYADSAGWLVADSTAGSLVMAGWFALTGVGFYGLTRIGAEVGIALSDTTVRLGRWPSQVHEINLADLAAAQVSPHVWTGEPLPPALASFPVRGFRYLTLHRHDGVTYHVAIDSANTYAEEIVAVLVRGKPLRRPTDITDPAGSRRKKADRKSGTADRPVPAERREPVGGKRSPQRSTDAETSERMLWEAAIGRHDQVLLGYLPYEIDPHLLMRYPALTDVTVPATAEFLDVLSEANALRTDAFPAKGSLAQRYRDTVKSLVAAWSRAEKNARQLGISLLDATQQRRIQQAGKLLRHAEGASTPAEQAVYLRQVSDILDQLTAEGAISTPPKIAAAIATRTRLALERARSGEDDDLERI